MAATSKFVGMPVLLILLVSPLHHAAKNPLSISLDAVLKPFGKHALSYPKETVETFMRGIEVLTENYDDKESKSDQTLYPSFPTYQTKLSIRYNSNIHRLIHGNINSSMNTKQKSVTAIVDISSPFIWVQGTTSLNMSSDYPPNLSCRPSDFPKSSGASQVADFIFPPSASNIKFSYDEEKRVDGLDGFFGVFGLSNNSCSLLKQLGYSNFSYCFAPSSSESSAILFGSDFTFRKNFEHQPALLVQNYQFPSSYSVSLIGISVGPTEVPVTALPFQENGPVTMIIDSVTPITLLKREVYESIKKEFLSQMNQLYTGNVTSSSLGLDLCFSNPTYWPKLSFKFSPAAIMLLSTENYVAKDLNTGMECLAILPSPDASVMGTLIQQNHIMSFDVDKSTVSFQQANCGDLSVSSATVAMVPCGVKMILRLIATLFAVMVSLG
ncbi:Eukaryotic aspartyl protease family protein [Rhynchospora pubera]|uniref:Eukaryotic aspartyl protease family protein n=1 Tax=Rhynchospora pubera TaxID=906938 RepID=A0AAV8GX51_9POAL|nr:Eukaryotic aspartyl protease family protein [Rhynchospora pubera]